MTKIETLKNLPTPSDLRQYVQQLSDLLNQTLERLAQTTEQVQSLKSLQSLEQLPGLTADRVSQAIKVLDPILSMPADVQKALEAFDLITQVQRSTLESMANELSRHAAQSMQLKVADLDTVLTLLSEQSKTMAATQATMQQHSAGLLALPQALETAAKKAAQRMQGSAQELMTAAERVRPRLWLTLGQMVASAALGGLLVAIGQPALSGLLPRSETQQNAALALDLWRKATEPEKKLMNQIVSRPDK